MFASFTRLLASKTVEIKRNCLGIYSFEDTRKCGGKACGGGFNSGSSDAEPVFFEILERLPDTIFGLLKLIELVAPIFLLVRIRHSL